MPLLTVRAVDAHRPRAQPYKITLDRGLQLRIAPDGARTLLVRYTVKGSNIERQYRLPLQYGEGPGQLRLGAACAEAARIRALARAGVDWTEAEDERLRSEAASKAALQRRDGLTLAKAVRDYVENKRRAKDGLALKARTRADYLAMVQGARTTDKGTRQAAGFLYPIARKVLTELTANDIREAYDAAAKKSPRRATYAMQVLRAVLRWHGVAVADNPLGRETAGRDRSRSRQPAAIHRRYRPSCWVPGGAPRKRRRLKWLRTTTASNF
jgi:Arm DNA-binding domain